MNANDRPNPPGAPGIEARWTSSAKSGLGKAINPSSNVIFTLSHGTLNEIYFPREDLACIRDMEFIVTDGNGFFSEEKRDTLHEIEWIKEGIPAFHITNICKSNRYVIEKEVITDPLRDVVLQKVSFKPSAENGKEKLKVFALLAPHLSNRGMENSGWIGDHKGVPMIHAHRNGLSVAIASDVGFSKRSVGYVGTSDGYTDLKQHRKMKWQYEKADFGNIALTAEIDISKSCEFVFAIGFGIRATDAAHSTWASLLDGFNAAKKKYIKGWERFQKNLRSAENAQEGILKNLLTSATVLRMHQSNVFAGGIVASISIPWGETKGDDNIGGYHLVWPRDLVESATGFLALDSREEVEKIVNYLMSVQENDGKWNQNTWLNGTPHWTGLQLDEIALPISLIDLFHTHYGLEQEKLHKYWCGIKKAIAVLISNGPSSQQDRWEEESGLSTFTLAAAITGLLGAARLAEINNAPEIARYCRETADYWNEQIEAWTYITDTPLSREAGVEGYYMRINPFDAPAEEVKDKSIYIKNRARENGRMHLYELISVDALALVRFGLRDARDPKILNTLKLIDKHLKVDTPFGPCWHRYTNDGYGEDELGNAYNDSGKGVGRAWPLLTGERGHYEVAAGNMEKATKLLKTMEAFANNGLLPEQVWDTEEIPEKGLFPGKHTGSAMPLTWAHAEYIKLCKSIQERGVFDMSLQTQERYLEKKMKPSFVVWRFNGPQIVIDTGKMLRIEVFAEAIIRYTLDHWRSFEDIEVENTGLGIFKADIDLRDHPSKSIVFTFFWKKARKWEGKNLSLKIKG